MSYEHRLVEAANGREFYDKIGRDADAEIAALHAELERKDAERDEWKRKYETQCAGSMSAHERRIHLEADLSALRAHMQAQQAVVDAAKKARQIALNAENVSSASALGEHVADIFNCLDAALKESS